MLQRSLPVDADLCKLPPSLMAAYLGTSSPTPRTISQFRYLAPVGMHQALDKA